MSFDNLPFERDGAVAVLSISRPRVLDALNFKTVSEPRNAALGPTHKTGVRAVVDLGSIPGYGGTARLMRLVDQGVALEPLLTGRRHVPCDRARPMEATLFGLVASTDDMLEGTTAFLEKRKARVTSK